MRSITHDCRGKIRSSCITDRQHPTIKVIGITVGAIWIGDLGEFACGVVGTGDQLARIVGCGRIGIVGKIGCPFS